jgi:hypothetical protein
MGFVSELPYQTKTEDIARPARLMPDSRLRPLTG